MDNYVEPGETLFSAVPLEVYVVANFKETQLTNLHPCQPAIVRVDAYPDIQLSEDRSTYTRKNYSRRSAGGSAVNITRDVCRGIRDIETTASLVEAPVPVEYRERWFGIACILR